MDTNKYPAKSNASAVCSNSEINILVVGLNVCRLTTKLDVFDKYEPYHVLIISTEIHTDESQEIIITQLFENNNFKVFFKHRKNLSVKDSG